MTEKLDLQQAIKEAVQTEKDAMDYYRYCAERIAEEKARKVFELLAREELEHARQFYKVYRGGELPPFEEFIAQPANADSVWLADLEELMIGDFDERKALELAIDKEEALERYLRQTAAKISDPEVKKIYLSNASSTHHHKELVEEEYADLMGTSR